MATGPDDQVVLDVTEEQIARTYAQGFLGAAGDASEAALADLTAVRDEVLRTHPKFAEILASAFLEHDQRVALLDSVLGGKVLPAVLNLLKVLSAHNRMGLVEGVVQQAQALHNESLNRVEVVVRLSHTVEDPLLGQIEQTIRTKTGIEPILRVEIDPELIGGLEVRVGDTVYDGSVRTAFAKAHKTIVQQTVQAIEDQPERFTLAS